MHNIKKYINLFKAGVCLYIICFLICKNDIIKSEIMSALGMWINIIVPSVFPYLIISQYIASSDIMNFLEVILGKWISKPLGITKSSIRCVICSFICGYPSGAICASMLYKNKKISMDEAEHLICFTNNAGPLFLISAVGTGLLGSAKNGCAMYVIQLMSAFIYGFVSKKEYSKYRFEISHTKDSDICTCIRNAVGTCINICGFMIAAYVLSGSIIYLIGVIYPECKYFYVISAGVRAIFEISAGVKEISIIDNGITGFAFMCAFVSWSGISVILQIKSVAPEIISIKKLCIAKFIQAVFSFILGFLYASLSGFKRYYPQKPYAIPIFLLITVIIFIVYVFTYSKNKKAFR